jgi:tetratricopeptide (TPR) repeat protein
MTDHSDDLLHIASCRTCRDRFTADNVVNFDADRHREPERMREFLETARRLERERAGVQDVVAGLLRTTPVADWSSLSAAPELRNSAAVEQLIEEVRKLGERKPLDSLTLAEVATAIAETLPAQSYPAVVLAQLRATAWKERANSLRYLSRHEEAFSAINVAEEHLSGFAAVAFDRAVVHLVKAMILHHACEDDAANKLLRECRAVFADHGDPKMLLCAGMIEGGILYEQSRYSEAHAVFSELLDVARAACDTDGVARIEANLGFCATHFGDLRRANIHFSNAIATLNDSGASLEATRVVRGAGRLLIAKGQINAGLGYLRNARRAFADANLAEDAVLCGLEIVATLIERGDTSEATELAHQITGEVAAAGLPEAAVTALERLDDVIREGGSELAVEVRNVHSFIESLQSPA